MRAMQVAAFGEPLRLVEVETPQPDPGEVQIAVHAAGVNYPDLLMIDGRYQVRPELPLIPGFEVAGIVSAVGSGVDRFVPGDRVIAFAFHGGYAESIVVPAESVSPVPEGVPFDVAAAIPLAYGTGRHALFDRGQLKVGETVVVLGAAGGVGLAAVELAAAAGASVIGCVGADWKRDDVLRAGASHVINYTDENVRERVKELTGGHGADVVYDPVGGDATDEALRYLAWRGRLLIIGFTSGRIADVPANRLLNKGASAIGVFWGVFAGREHEAKEADFRWIAERVLDGRLSPVIAGRFPLERAADALALLEERKVVGRQVLIVR